LFPIFWILVWIKRPISRNLEKHNESLKKNISLKTNKNAFLTFTLLLGYTFISCLVEVYFQIWLFLYLLLWIYILFLHLQWFKFFGFTCLVLYWILYSSQSLYGGILPTQYQLVYMGKYLLYHFNRISFT